MTTICATLATRITTVTRDLRAVFTSLASCATKFAHDGNAFHIDPDEGITVTDMDFTRYDKNGAASYTVAIPGTATGKCGAVIRKAGFRTLRACLKGLKPSHPLVIQILDDAYGRVVTIMDAVTDEVRASVRGPAMAITTGRTIIGDLVDWPGKVNAAAFLATLADTAPARSTDDSRPVLNSWGLDVLEASDQTAIIGTSGHALVSRPVGDNTRGMKPGQGRTFTGRWLTIRRILTAAAKRADNFHVMVGSDEGLRITGDGFSMDLPSAGHYPNVNRVTARETRRVASWELENGAIRQAVDFCNSAPKDREIAAEIAPGALSLMYARRGERATDLDWRESLRLPVVTMEGDTGIARFNPKLLATGMAAVEANGVPVQVHADKLGGIARCQTGNRKAIGRIDLMDPRGTWCAVMGLRMV